MTVAAVMAMTGCGGNDAADDSADAGETYTVGIIQQLEHPALDAATKGFEDKLTELLIAEDAIHAGRHIFHCHPMFLQNIYFSPLDASFLF